MLKYDILRKVALDCLSSIERIYILSCGNECDCRRGLD
jgi:hypothetical protein